jgi:ketosteroid isomerase-like protein
MRALTAIFLTVLMSLLAITASSQNETDTTEILGLYQGWRDAVENANIDGYVAVLHADISLRPPGAQGLDGRDKYAVFLEPVFESASYEIQIDNAPSVTFLGSAALVEYDYTIYRHDHIDSTADLPPGAIARAKTSAHYIDVVTRDSSGAWKVRLHSWQDWPAEI